MAGMFVGMNVLLSWWLEVPPIEGWLTPLIGLVGLGGVGAGLGRRLVQSRLRATVDALRADRATARQLVGYRDGEVVRVRGTVRRGPDGGLPGDLDVVFERVLAGATLIARGTITERAVDFILLDEEGEELTVDVSEARLVHVFPERRDERVQVRVGHRVEVIGRKHRIVDPEAEPSLREAAMRVVLRAPLSAPLLIVLLPTERTDRLLGERRGNDLSGASAL
jgi:hypothetical protein